MSGLLCEVTPDNFCERTFEVRPQRVKVYEVIAGANRNCLPELSKKVLCLQLLYPGLTFTAPCSFWLPMALHTLPRHSSQSVRLEPPKASVENRMTGHTGHYHSISATWAVGSQELRFMHSTCLRRIHGRKLGSILPFIKGRMPPKPTGEKRTAFCPSPIQNSTPKNYNQSSLNYGTLSQAIPQFQLVSAVLLAPPSDPSGINEVWGSICFLFCPSPGSLRDLQGLGHIEVDVI